MAARPNRAGAFCSAIRRTFAVITALAIVFSMLVLPKTPVQAESAHQAVIGMPFVGKWAYNVNVNPPYTDWNSSHPSVHATHYGNWATDLYAATGTAVKFRVGYATGSLSYSWTSVANGSCGQRTVINIKVSGVTVGSVYYEHMANAVKSGSIVNGMTVGYVHDWGGCNPGPHVHVEFKNVTANACYVDHGHPGVTLKAGTNLGVLGSTNSGPKQKCASVPSAPPNEPSSAPVIDRAGDIATVNQENGRPEVFYVGGDNAIWYRWQNADGTWSAESRLGGGAKAITAIQRADGRIEILYIGGDNAIWYRQQVSPNTNAWSAEHTIAAGGSQITATAQPDGRIGVFYIGGDGAIWYRWQNTDDTWSAEHTLPSGVKVLSATKTIDGKIELFYSGGDGAVWHRWQTSPNADNWSAEHKLGGGGVKAITATNQANGLEEVFYVGGDNAIWYRWQNADGTWSAEHTLAAGASAITSVLKDDGRIQLFYVGGDNAVWTRWQNDPDAGAWSAEHKLGGGVG